MEISFGNSRGGIKTVSNDRRFMEYASHLTRSEESLQID